MRKKLIATSSGPGGSGSSYEFTIDDAPPMPEMAEQAAAIDDTQPTDNTSGNIPAEAKQAIVLGDIDGAKAALEKAGYSVEIRDIGQPEA